MSKRPEGVPVGKILLVGCGQIGSRHLQAVACLADVGRVDVVDPQESSLQLGQARLKDVSEANLSVVYGWHTSIDSAEKRADLCIVATSAQGRVELVKEIFEKTGVKKFIIEKLAAQSVLEYQDLMAYAQKYELSVWVNCPTRAYAIHQYIKAKIDPSEQITFSEIGGNHGLVCNGIHYVDLFLFYDATNEIIPAGAVIDPVLHPSKRGKDLFDLSGMLTGYSAKGSKFVLSYAGQHTLPDVVTITTNRHRFVVDVINGWAQESLDGQAWQNIPVETNIRVSHSTRIFCKDIFEKNACDLPTLQECWPAHQYILTELLPHFNQLLKTENEFCPAT